MTDPFTMPPERDLPDAVRAMARARIEEGLTARPARRSARLLVPLSIAAAVVVLAAFTLTVTALRHAPTPSDSIALAPVPGPRDGSAVTSADLTASHPTGNVADDEVLRNQAPAHLGDRCAAQGSANGRSASDQWQPVVTVIKDEVAVIAYRTPAGALFCEVTPATVTLSAPAPGSVSGTVEPTFLTSFGSVAGLIGPQYQDVSVINPEWGQGITMDGVVSGGVFVAPNALSVPVDGVTFSVRPAGAATTDTTIVVGKQQLPAIAPSVTDVSVPTADQSSAEGGKLAGCLAGSGAPAAVDPAAWVPGASVDLNDHQHLQLGTYGQLLAVCDLDSQPDLARGYPSTRLDIYNQDNPPYPLEVEDNLFITATVVFNDRPTTAGAQLVAIVGQLKSAKVAGVRLSWPGGPTITGIVRNGSYILPGLDDASAIAADQDPIITMYDANGAALAQVPIAD